VLKILTTAPEIASPPELDTLPEILTAWENTELTAIARTKALKIALLIRPPFAPASLFV
jgi:hypothetical protein